MDNPAQVTALTNRGWTGDTTVGQTRLDEAWRALRREVPSIENSITTEAITSEDVVDVLAAAALRVLRNPDGYESGSNQLDDFNESWRRADASADLYFTAAELRRLNVHSYSDWSFSGSLPYNR